MCGIAGLYTPGREVSLAATLPMLDALAHRGPDGQGQFLDQDLVLLHARLSIIDLQQGQQPLYSQSGEQVLVANGEIYNHVELRASLSAQGNRFSTHSDCEVILPLAERDPTGFAAQLKGMFALALFDKTDRSLTLVRDRFGIKPLYYMEVPGGIAFASETKALLPLLPSIAGIEASAVGRFLQINFASGEQTAFKSIRRLPPGGRLRIDANGQITLSQWWSLADELARQPVFSGQLPEAVACFDQLLNRALTEHLRADVPVGLFLSGGVDSSILATQLARLPAQSGTPKAWSLGFDSQSVQDEATAAAEMAKTCGIELDVIRVNPITLFDHLVYAIWATDELMGDFAALPTLLLAEAASVSHKVVLTGEGGDEVFAGYGRYRMPRLQRWLYALRSPGTGGFRTRGRFDKALPAAWLKSHWRRQMQQDWRQPFQQSWQEAAALEDLQKQQYTDMQTWLADDLLTKADRMLMVQGVEGRVPFLDHELVLFGLSLPASLKIQGRIGKQVPRAWLQQQSGVNSMGRKRGFSVPVVDWVQSLDRTQLALALTQSAALQEILEPAALRASLKQPGPLDKSLVEPLAALLQFAIWSKLFIESPGQVPPRRVEPLSWLLS
ncbi:Asparagine synthetase [Nitrincola lacisaponensis]|uniref:asparagine synthase (glutamine-hydrolyzing) n=1 Tax=Nitrincola lacisaponensis TaxID=267850 RepID=A0A063Y6Q6_9GAMM|nr:asparagine synthase (glutamine-hydrolyzing) [Nitrincola lacisaponensis]KDE40112.1 Asparagine synthetase [Nitrincola lacisaponensis]